ncbi:Ile-tRNA lysidine synthase [Ameyamaea chiangmaiensis NBRC 103196]|nr:tRNA lysidine(34) synthetase TilS [Ameyamaea chiangmaiensis]MBS4074833.1 tRNA lysidine(34) synthetase TilS [Ameyamaea chiangmaiensis]GBQ62894.1 Ile-tRNA lysidine synthase [Ameyamaea chiangmaiensis NBRC 103196]
MEAEAQATPVSDAAFAARIAMLGPWPSEAVPVAIAVSGGADSLCLALLARRWRRNVVGLVVDHGLRATSRAEALLTLDRLAALDIPAQLLSLTNLSPGPGLSARARTARYAALTRACVAVGALDLLLGHHADDQRETARIRTRARSGEDGLACMAASVAGPDIRLVRPLLGFGRHILRARLCAEGQRWVEDPSNRDPRWERARVRADLATRTEDEHRALTRHIDRAAHARRAREADSTRCLIDSVRVHPGGWAELPPDLPPVAVLSRLIRVVGARPYPPPATALDRLVATPGPATLGGTRLITQGAGWLLVREEAAMAPAVPAVQGALWDGRFRLTLAPGVRLPDGTVLGPLADGVHALARRDRDWPAVALRCLPALWYGGRLIGSMARGLSLPPGVRLDLTPPSTVADSALWLPAEAMANSADQGS